MATLIFVHVDSLETEGDAREAYAAWMADMEGATIVASAEPLAIATEVEDLPF